MAEELPITQAPLNKARKDKYRLVLSIPNILKTIEARSPRESEYINLDSIQFSVFGVNIPSPQVPNVPLHFAGQTYNVTSFNRPDYQPVSVNFTIDNEFKNYWIIWKWLQLFNDPIAGTYGGPDIFDANGGQYPKLEPETLYDYTTDITLFGLDEYNNEKIKFLFKYAFVTQLGDYSYSYRDPGEIECNFQFTFNQLDIELV